MSLGHGASVVRNGLVLHLDAANRKSYPGTGSTWFNMSGNQFHGTISNSSYSTNARGEFSFNGSNSLISISSASAITTLTNNFTTEVWYQSNNTNPQLWYTRIPSGGFMIGRGNTGNGWKVTKYTVVDIYLGTVPQDTKWHQVVCVFSSTAGTSLYLDGKLNGASATDTGNLNGASTNGTINVGQAEFGVLNGLVGVSRVYNRVLSAVEISQNFNALRGRYGI